MKTSLLFFLFFIVIGLYAQTDAKQATKSAFEPKYLRKAFEDYKVQMKFDMTDKALANALLPVETWLNTPSDTLEKQEKTFAFLYEAAKIASESIEPNADSLLLDLIYKSHEAELPEFVYGQFANLLLKSNYVKGYKRFYAAVQTDTLTPELYFNLSFFALFVGQYTQAIEAAQKTLQLDPNSVKVETNLALGYLLNNQYDQAEAIYKKWKGKKFDAADEETANQIFLKDISDLEQSGIQHKDFKKVKLLLAE